jgi:hypothetical protein
MSRFFPKEVGKGVRLDLFSIMLMQVQYSTHSRDLSLRSVLFLRNHSMSLPTNVDRPIVQVDVGICTSTVGDIDARPRLVSASTRKPSR